MLPKHVIAEPVDSRPYFTRDAIFGMVASGAAEIKCAYTVER
ncbi:MAG: hypothetical protein ETSY1_20145 [Candidatus Entotheonella factor]|uniref:Uncharacterized protein n=1 Tax=Entotheonella factor TaxID=1429438 RepID=W4LJ15_ENTF1|nr:hypothetical protein [Candidatus Entotheonella palauensis]ETW98103.1 MAG: hypothetical protein ETSY1_20145 [Candidatus Entotheonella factor]